MSSARLFVLGAKEATMRATCEWKKKRDDDRALFRAGTPIRANFSAYVEAERLELFVRKRAVRPVFSSISRNSNPPGMMRSPR